QPGCLASFSVVKSALTLFEDASKGNVKLNTGGSIEATARVTCSHLSNCRKCFPTPLPVKEKLGWSTVRSSEADFCSGLSLNPDTFSDILSRCNLSLLGTR